MTGGGLAISCPESLVYHDVVASQKYQPEAAETVYVSSVALPQASVLLEIVERLYFLLYVFGARDAFPDFCFISQMALRHKRFVQPWSKVAETQRV